MQQILDIILRLIKGFLQKKTAPVIAPIIDERTPGAVKITSAYPKYTGLKLHKGIDISAKKGAPVYAICDGVVAKTRHGSKGKPGASYVMLPLAA